VESATVIQVP